MKKNPFTAVWNKLVSVFSTGRAPTLAQDKPQVVKPKPQPQAASPKPQQQPQAAVPAKIISAAALKLILKHEVGGGAAYYNSKLTRPTYPGGASGVTIGIGYDLGHTSAEQFTADWKGKISNADFTALRSTIGLKSAAAKAAVRGVSAIKIPWETAIEVFKTSTLPRFINLTLRTFPKSEALHPDAFGALVSLVFNRGSSLSGPSRVEMANIRKATSGALAVKDVYDYIANQITAMKRLWVGKNLDGLLRRRDEEAALVRRAGKV